MKFVVIGGGSIGKRHLSNLYTLGYKDIYCYKREMSKEFEIENKCKVITSIDSLKEINPDVILICNPTSMHGEWIKIGESIDAHIFVEKPLVHSKEDLENIKHKLSGYDKVFFIGFMLRYHPLVKKIKTLLSENVIGSVYSARLEFGSWLPYWHPWEDYKISYASRKEMGGGVINTITHELDLAQYFFGSPKGLKNVNANLGILDIEVEEISESILSYDDKLVTLHVDYLQKDYDRSIRILGVDGKIIWDWHSNEVKVNKHNDIKEIYRLENFDVNNLYVDELKDFISLIEQNKPNHELDFNYAISNTELMLQLHENGLKK